MKAILLLPALCGLCIAANVFIFNYDQVDLIYDPVVGDSIDTGYWVEQTLLALGDTVDSGTSLPGDISPYDAVFMMMGMYTC
ncbi:MAG TPA: hypothetical protein PLM22_10420 [Candidatus Sabulitectum sp.]|nr:hypothetical protein [Candidatus Sabulitectum sp.]HPF31647.1 hypothetical protein [Candidatus Sabulitectum sp.]HPJ29339.1 hypothetical protein [Candidatus Sabulitectum sp.]HPR22139.1 hypothetical protein [Candidatus Sabulitectum sp.]HRW77867.1 hypothetical protein [Candidatus Sabulitectum sp.]